MGKGRRATGPRAAATALVALALAGAAAGQAMAGRPGALCADLRHWPPSPEVRWYQDSWPPMQ